MNKKLEQFKLFNEEEAYRQAMKLLKECRTEYGFVASVTKKYNYHRIFSRDGVIMGLASLMSGDKDLIGSFLDSLLTLKKYQGKQGQIPSNVDYRKKTVSYGGTAGRVDATLWYVIGCVKYYRFTNDKKFFKKIYSSLEKCVELLSAWEYNQKGFIFVPPTGDWADEYIQEGYVLYDQLLYYLVLKEYAFARRVFKKDHKDVLKKAYRLKRLIRANYWLEDDACDYKYIYHPILHMKGKKNRRVKQKQSYWLPYFSPTGYGYYFDAFANILSSLLGIAEGFQVERIDDFIARNFADRKNFLLPPFHPVIKPGDKKWPELSTAFSHRFKNRPYQYHNGGLWPVITGFYVLDLAGRGKIGLAKEYLKGINRANYNSVKRNGEWEFNEWFHGKIFKPSGTERQGWSAAATVMAYHAVKGGKNIFK